MSFVLEIAEPERWLLVPRGGPEYEVTRRRWIEAERDAGFVGSGSVFEPSTRAFTTAFMSGNHTFRRRRLLRFPTAETLLWAARVCWLLDWEVDGAAAAKRQPRLQANDERPPQGGACP